MGRYRHVAVLMGGPSAEREISLRSGQAVAGGLRAAGYTVDEVDVRDRAVPLPAGVEAVFIALHGEFGEDGGVQRVLRARGIPYTGSDPDSSARAFDKRLSKQVMAANGVPTPRWELARAGGLCGLPLPVVVKPPRQGSSLGISCVRVAAEWPAALADALRYEAEALVEVFVPGRELTVGLVDGEALPVVEIRPRGGWYGYEEKYKPGLTAYEAPARLPDEVSARCRELALATYRALGCRGLGRVDFRMTPTGELFVLEMNTIPGFTETSLLPKGAAAAGLAFPQLCARILETAAV